MVARIRSASLHYIYTHYIEYILIDDNIFVFVLCVCVCFVWSVVQSIGRIFFFYDGVVFHADFPWMKLIYIHIETISIQTYHFHINTSTPPNLNRT